MKAKDLRELSREDLIKKGNDLKEDLFKLKFKHSIRPIDNPDRLRQLKRDIARVKTVAAE